MKHFLLILALLFTTIPQVEAAKADRTYGTLVVQKVVSVYDGDSFRADIAGVHPLLGKDIGIRVYGVDTPEIRGKCDSEKAAAKNVKRFVEQVLRTANTIELREVRRDKYFRINAVVVVDGRSLGAMLIQRNMAYPYFGKTKREWCN
ncbi:MAG: thermonuclease family protein [Neptunomonas phycophila]|uniref:thermonuclease family protein n=1 Tax=Neptunomonas phycophila TaxID=1572645 RepID=UPI003B8C3AE2